MEAISLRDTYKAYRANCNTEKKYQIKTYSKVLDLFMLKIKERLKNEGQVSMPCALGTIEIKGKKIVPSTDEKGNPKNLAPDWKLTKQMWEKYPDLKEKKELFYHTNDATNGVRYRMYWNIPNNADIQFVFGFYTFVAARFLRREVSHLITAGKEYLIK